MSDHWVEDLVEHSIRLLDSHHPADDRRVRNWIGVLYRVQDQCDCSFTHFRVMDILLRRGFTFRFPPDEHPDYRERKETFDALTGFTALRDVDEDDDSGWLEDGYFDPDPPLVYCDVGSALWHRMVRLGRLTGPDADPLREVPLIDVLQAIAIAGEELGDRTLITDWRELEPTLCDLYDLGA
ncbi:hypothetical protein PV416_22780 [Streptomyces ipomoeae]|uniref:hypothetical protein n=1 Tax=Streptomyces ipomoeae TaxID=103232 RepID=UPI001146E104|nr:hypothetical protein [Streptomyces ipomoeae]MDX2823845.1 hypothetical protein [Streptomyces ipomoeae]MDX2876453.1 hypothetical protein [Streptomyces ipomoeae]TQE26289.1 hypothetical protein Sipo7851_33440 [Streptomyces ipomoeae]